MTDPVQRNPYPFDVTSPAPFQRPGIAESKKSPDAKVQESIRIPASGEQCEGKP